MLICAGGLRCPGGQGGVAETDERDWDNHRGGTVIIISGEYRRLKRPVIRVSSYGTVSVYYSSTLSTMLKTGLLITGLRFTIALSR
jgi:hypothetical protein